jgi:hypothetical protein
MLTTGLIVGLTLVAADETATGKYTLQERYAVSDQFQNRVHLLIRGEIQAGKEQRSLSGQALLEFEERVATLGADAEPKDMIRLYTDARAKFVMGEHEDPRQLRPERRLLIAQRADNDLIVWTPAGPLVSEERELVEDVLDPCRLNGLMPIDEVAIGDTWKPEAFAIQRAFDLDHFIESTVECKLESVNEGKAMITIAGVTHGISLGTAAKSKVEATLTYNLAEALIEKAQWRQVDGRNGGPVSPMGAYDVHITIDRKRQPNEKLTDQIVSTISTEPKQGAMLLAFTHPEQGVRFHHGRDWHVTTVTNNRVVMRKIGGDVLVAQLNVLVLPNRKAGTVMTPEEFESTINEDVNWKIASVSRVDELPTDGTIMVRLLEAAGVQEDSPKVQRHYLVTNPAGRQLIASFALEPENAELLGTDDLGLVTGVEFPPELTAKQDEEPKN